MYGRTGIVIGILCALAIGGCANQKTPPPPKVVTDSTSTPTGASREQAVTAQAIVTAIDLPNRIVTLRLSDGDVISLRVGDDVRNLAQVKRGDHVMVVYYESIAFRVLKPGEAKPSITTDKDTQVAPLGERPGAATSRETTIVAKILRLDQQKQQAVLRGPKGRRVTVKVRDPSTFDKVRVGDSVEITYVEALAIDVQPRGSSKRLRSLRSRQRAATSAATN